MTKKVYSCGISKIDRFPKAINNKVNICLLHDNDTDLQVNETFLLTLELAGYN